MATDPIESFQRSRGHLVTMAAKILQNRRESPIHAILPEKLEIDQEDDLDFSNVSSVEDIVAAVDRWKNRRNGRQGARPQGGRREAASQPPKPVVGRPPRKCPNCGGGSRGETLPEATSGFQGPTLLELRQARPHWGTVPEQQDQGPRRWPPRRNH